MAMWCCTVKLPSKLLPLLAGLALVVATACETEYEKHYDLASQLRKEERFTEAIEQYKLAAQADPDNPKPYYRMGSIYKGQGEHLKAAECYRKAIEVDPDYVDAYPELVKALRRCGELDEATKIANEALQKRVVKRSMEVATEIQEQLVEIEKARRGEPTDQPPPTAPEGDLAPETDATTSTAPAAGQP
ncbi:hypothetical protein AMJ85_09975 [candidate division BRC1 bacterium SM23_51]|nr:MAG: hypothetical protein AMJ85_09975 [candidate division BRC1 bacterium SM23_51]